MANIIEKSIAKICIEMVKEDVIDKKEYFIYKYNLQIIAEKTITLVPVIGISILFHRLVEMVVFIISFSALRKYTGGFHCKTFLGCFILSFLTCLSIIPLALILKRHFKTYLVLLVLSALLILWIGSINNQYIDWNETELMQAKKRSRISCLIVLICSLFLSFNVCLRDYSLYVGMGLLQTSFSLMLYRITAKGGTKYETETT